MEAYFLPPKKIISAAQRTEANLFAAKNFRLRKDPGPTFFWSRKNSAAQEQGADFWSPRKMIGCARDGNRFLFWFLWGDATDYQLRKKTEADFLFSARTIIRPAKPGADFIRREQLSVVQSGARYVKSPRKIIGRAGGPFMTWPRKVIGYARRRGTP